MPSERKVRAWAIVDDDGNIVPSLCFANKVDAECAVFALAEKQPPSYDRIIPVEIHFPPEDGT